jgi:hypothetical protein
VKVENIVYVKEKSVTLRYWIAVGTVLFLFVERGTAQQEIEAKLSGNTSSQGFNVKNASGTSLFRVGGDGNVGIGTTTPSKSLQIYKSGGTSDEISFGADQWLLGRYNTNDFRIYHGAAQQLYMTGDGKVGIGTASPAATLDVNGSVISGSHRLAPYNSKIELMGTGASGKYWTIDPAAFVDDQFGILRYESNAVVPDKSIILTNAGNLGVGMTTPAQKLVVKQTTPNIWASYIHTSGVSTGASYGLVVAAGTNANDVAFQVRNQAGTKMFSVRGDGGTSIGEYATAAGTSLAVGTNVTASGGGTLAVGVNATASGQNSIALGTYVNTNGMAGSFALGDVSTTTVMDNGLDNQFKARFDGGFTLYTNYNYSTGVSMPHGTSGWTNPCDRNRKEHISELDGESVLSRIREIPVTEWNYKNTDPNIRYIGPMAQDFWQAFHLGGTDSLGINSISIDGVNMAAVKALEARTKDLSLMRRELTRLKEQVAGLSALREDVEALREMLRRKRDDEARVTRVSTQAVREQ